MSSSLRIEDVDVFTIPHYRMKQLLRQASIKFQSTDFNDTSSFFCLIKELISTFVELKHHEEIENKYIMKILRQKLHGEALNKLIRHIHVHSHIADILKNVKKTEQEFKEGLFDDLKRQGTKLTDIFQRFFDEYIPHMIEEEKVLQPLLMEFLSRSELRQIKNIVLQLHDLKDEIKEEDFKLPSQEPPDVKCEYALPSSEEDVTESFPLPTEIMIKIFAYLDIQDLCHCSQVSKSWNEQSYTGVLWKTLRPSRWALGDWRCGGDLTSDDCNCDCQPNYNLSTFKDVTDEKSSVGSFDSLSDNEDALDEQVKKEAVILNGFNRYVLPRVGGSVKTLVLECSKAVTNGLLFRMLTHCSNLEYLDVSQTIISDLGLMGLFKVGCPKLRYLDVSGCINVTDKALQKLSSALGKVKCTCKLENDVGDEDKYSKRQLRTLRLSGCYKITDTGLKSLAKFGGLPNLHHLDLSGCLNITLPGIKAIVAAAPMLDSNEFFYCDNIYDENFEYEASGCQNDGCANRICCRTFR